MSEWNHDSLPQFFGGPGKPPVGTGRITEGTDKDSKFLIGEFDFLDDDHRSERTYQLLDMHRSMQWSIAYNGKQDEDGRMSNLDIFEASPVVKGASPGTRVTGVEMLDAATPEQLSEIKERLMKDIEPKPQGLLPAVKAILSKYRQGDAT